MWNFSAVMKIGINLFLRMGLIKSYFTRVKRLYSDRINNFYKRVIGLNQRGTILKKFCHAKLAKIG